MPNHPYGPDLAYVHDAGFGQLARDAARLLVQGLKKSRLVDGMVVDCGCGSGILAEPVAAAGYKVIGIDLSHAMIDLARQRVPEAEFHVGSILRFDLPAPCVAVAAVGEVCNYLFDEGHTKTRVWQLFRRVFETLCPGGLFLFDVAGPGRVPGRGAQQKYVDREDWTCLVTADEDYRHGMVTRRITSFRKVAGGLYRRHDEVHQLRLFDPTEVTSKLRQIGFAVRPLHSYGSHPMPSGLRAYLARKVRRT